MTIKYHNKDGSIISQYGNWESIDITTTDDTETTAWELITNPANSVAHVQAYIAASTTSTFIDNYLSLIDYATIKPTTGQDINRNWGDVTIDSDGSNIGILASNCCCISTDSGLTFDEKYVDSLDLESYSCIAMGSNGSNIAVASFLGSGESSVFLSNDSGLTWLETFPNGSTGGFWYCIDMDSDGSVLIIGDINGRLWLSTNSGNSWAETQPKGDDSGIWLSVACNSDGSVILAADLMGRLWHSTNTGGSWVDAQPSGDEDRNWACVDMDSDGSVLIAGESVGRLWLSTNSGSSWSEVRPKGDVNAAWGSVACDSDGSNLIAVEEYGGSVWTSVNSGADWTERISVSGNKVSCCSNSDGSILGVVDYGNRVWLSVNSGVDWTEIRPATTQEFLSNQYLTYENSDETIFQKCEFDVFANRVKLKIQGKAATTINWKMYIMSMNL